MNFTKLSIITTSKSELTFVMLNSFFLSSFHSFKNLMTNSSTKVSLIVLMSLIQGGCRVTPLGYAQMTHMLSSLAGGKVILALEVK